MLSLVNLSNRLLLLRCPAPAGFVVGRSCSFTTFCARAARDVAGLGAAVDGFGGGAGRSFVDVVLSTGELMSVDEAEERLHMKDNDDGQVLQILETIFTCDGKSLVDIETSWHDIK